MTSSHGPSPSLARRHHQPSALSHHANLEMSLLHRIAPAGSHFWHETSLQKHNLINGVTGILSAHDLGRYARAPRLRPSPVVVSH